MTRLSVPRLPVAPAEPDDTAVVEPPTVDQYRLQLMADQRLSIMHTRLYDHWRPRVGAPTAYRLALLGWSNEAEYQRLKREAMAS